MMDIALLQQMIEGGWVSVQKHPEAALYLYNYTQQTQYEGQWNEVTMACRGLILDEQMGVVARPFPKFFNLEEVNPQQIPMEPFEVFEKMDGSLGVLYWHHDKPYLATRGSFSSEQAAVANELLHTRYAHAHGRLKKGVTYLFEIIYPENRIVVDYGDKRELVLLAMLDTATGSDLPLEELGFPVVKKYDGLTDLHALKARQEANKEGFVVRFRSGLRLKVKFEDYVRIHKIITRVSSITIWEYLRDAKPLNELLEEVPDEFFYWVRAKVAQLEAAYTQIEAAAKAEFRVLESRKESALYYQSCQYPAILFKLYEGKKYDQIIWKMVRPAFEKPFTNERIDS